MITEAHVGFTRLQELLELRDYVHPSNRAVPASLDTSIELKDASLSWEVMKVDAKRKPNKKDKKDEAEKLSNIEFIPCLFDLNLEIKKGELIGVSGGVGSGKTSLISAIMGEVRHTFLDSILIQLPPDVSGERLSQSEWFPGSGVSADMDL